MVNFERKLTTEQADIAEIVSGIRTLQARVAARANRSLGRGTHAKGVCVRGEFEVLDLASTVEDGGLRGRLARGLFATPGTYPATIRFANGASKMAADGKRDLRGLSFAVEVPPGLFEPAVIRIDFALNDGRIFPLNDTHAFAMVLRVAAAKGLIGTAAAVWSLSFRDLGSLIASGVRVRRLEGPGLTPYQRLRYWSMTPFRHGPDEAAKYTVIPHPDNPARRLGPGADVLRDELIRHVAEDERMSAFDFGLQLLDVDRMTDRRGRHDAAYWIENGSVDWREAQAPFHVVGRLRLLRGEHLSAAECRATYFDVREHCAPGCEPLGGINRARGAAESASREARLARPAPAGSTLGDEAPAPRRSIRRAMFKAAALLVLLGLPAFSALLYLPQWTAPPLERVDSVEVLDQGWGQGLEAADRQRFYYTSQGALLKGIRYSWFVHLELPWGRARFADPEYLARYGFIADPATPQNPDGLPIGFTKYFDRQLNEEIIDLTCAACHTGQIHVARGGRTIAIRIDGGAAMFDLNEAMPPLLAAMVSTVMNPIKFNRFARNVLGDQYPRGRLALHVKMLRVLAGFGDIVWNEMVVRDLHPTEEGYGRTDGLTRISNMLFAENLDPKNYSRGTGPVSYPPLWDIWKFDWVQYNASLSQPMARNIGEALGVGAKTVLTDGMGRPLPPGERFRSTAHVENMHVVETTLRKLRPPLWPERLLGAVDRATAERGQVLFNQYCVGCHGPHIAPAAIKARNAPLKGSDEPEWLLPAICIDDVGTDPNTAVNYMNAVVDLTRTGLTAAELRAVARPTLAAWNTRQTAYLTGEIARLNAEIALARMDPASADARRGQVAALEAQMAGLDAAMERTLSEIDPARLPVSAAINYVGAMIREGAYADLQFTPEMRADRDGFGILDFSRALAAYKPRPLAGMWSTAPFLHNGSVPTLFDLLSPADERPKTFRVGSRAYDTERMGLVGKDGAFLFDTAVSGNSNRGHEFGRGSAPSGTGGAVPGIIGPYLEPADRLAIIEHLKIRDDDLDGPRDAVSVPSYPACSAGPTAR